jgi:hypothetical protein
MIRVDDERARFLNQAGAVLIRAVAVAALTLGGARVLFFERRELGGELRGVALLPFFVTVAERVSERHSHFTFFRNT